MVHVSAYPNCAPACEYVAIPLGSSSEAPVIRPGHRTRATAVWSFDDSAVAIEVA
jgi:hypothetical protein